MFEWFLLFRTWALHLAGMEALELGPARDVWCWGERVVVHGYWEASLAAYAGSERVASFPTTWAGDVEGAPGIAVAQRAEARRGGEIAVLDPDLRPLWRQPVERLDADWSRPDAFLAEGEVQWVTLGRHIGGHSLLLHPPTGEERTIRVTNSTAIFTPQSAFPVVFQRAEGIASPVLGSLDSPEGQPSGLLYLPQDAPRARFGRDGALATFTDAGFAVLDLGARRVRWEVELGGAEVGGLGLEELPELGLWLVAVGQELLGFDHEGEALPWAGPAPRLPPPDQYGDPVVLRRCGGGEVLHLSSDGEALHRLRLERVPVRRR